MDGSRPDSTEITEIIEVPKELIADGTNFKLKSVDPEEMADGAEKLVYEATDGTNSYAAKIYKKSRTLDDKPIVLTPKEVEEMARKEFDAYQRFSEGPLAPYVPKAHFLLRNSQEEVVGLAVDWIAGDSLAEFSSRPLSEGQVGKLRDAFMSFTDSEQKPDGEMMENLNLIIVDEEPGIKIAECSVDNEFWQKNDYTTYVSKQMTSLSSEYANSK